MSRIWFRALTASVAILSAGCHVHPGRGPVIHRPAPAPITPVAPVVIAPRPGTVLVQPAPPPPRVVARPASPGPHHAWVEGHWDWTGREYVWHNGHWAQPPRRGAVWVAGTWRHHGTSHAYVQGYWK